MEWVTAGAEHSSFRPPQPADPAACGLSTPVATSPMLAAPHAIRYQTDGMLTGRNGRLPWR
ncbi:MULTISPECIES: hypothetical protein [unclassified Streptomyces]|uniref:hypothetical protein n=1 Tax=unclassified Streptomyces TaxID=2593676 RepID=UPI0004C2AE1A|nr:MULTISPECIES: hypothetical protein [unclassified Streptomyces]